MSNCIECGKEYTPFVDGHTLMCAACYEKFLNQASIPNNSKPRTKELPVINNRPGINNSPIVKKKVDMDYEQLEKYHKSFEFHQKFYK